MTDRDFIIEYITEIYQHTFYVNLMRDEVLWDNISIKKLLEA
jgi:hypothetical protein